MNKNLILAIALSFLVMITWSRLTQKFYPIDTQEVKDKNAQQAPQLEPSHIVLPEDKEESLVNVISNDRELVFSLPQACLKKVTFSQFNDYDFSLGKGLCLIDQDLVFTQERLDSTEAIFVHQDESKRITKKFNYSDSNFTITLDIKIENLSGQPLAYPYSLALGAIDLNSKGIEGRFKEIFLKQPDRILRLSPSRITKIHYGGDFFGFRERYFCAIIMPMSFPETLSVQRIDRRQTQLILSLPTINLLPNQAQHLQYSMYIGPQQNNLLNLFHNRAGEIIYYGVFDPIAKLLLNILRFFSGLVHNLGWAIIALSIFIFFILFPLSMKQMRSARDMQRLQPKIEELRILYKDNPQRLNKEVLELYRKHRINPLGGCLPLILQIPIFFSLYQALIRSIELKGANFLWIEDLSQPDRLIINPEVNILPILMAITMFLQQKFTMMSAAGHSGEQQRLMTLLFPILFGFIFYRMPSGLVLYWFVNSLLMFIYQMRIKLVHEPARY